MVSLHVSTIQRYSTKDGPGIRSTVFLIGCNLRCVWCSNPAAAFLIAVPEMSKLCTRISGCGIYAGWRTSYAQDGAAAFLRAGGNLSL